MKENKNIERIFQEKFKDFEATPPEANWNAIADRLKQNKKRRILPFWLRTSGIAAGLLLFFAFVYIYFSSSFEPVENGTKITVTDSTTLKNELELKDDVIVLENNNLDEKTTSSSHENITNAIQDKDKAIGKKSPKGINEIASLKSEKISSTNNPVQKTEVTDSKKSNTEKTIFEKETIFGNELVFSSEKPLQKTKNSLGSLNTIDSLGFNNNTPENPLTQLLLEKDKKKEDGKVAMKIEKESKWAISSQVSPVYFNSFTDGSALDFQFENNNKSYSNSVSYGFGASYNVSKKVSFKTGVNAINLSYSTSDVAYEVMLKGADLSNNMPLLARTSTSENVMLKSNNTVTTNAFGDVENFNQQSLGTLNQDFSYIEIPFEMNYSLLDRKFGVSVIAGMSTLILSNNSVSLSTGGMEMNLGSAKNLNDIHFSSNVGLGFKYSFWKSFNANFQPMLKYQINPLSENPGNFRPYFIGLYSGVSYQF